MSLGLIGCTQSNGGANDGGHHAMPASAAKPAGNSPVGEGLSAVGETAMPAGRVVEFVPGIRIDYRVPQVEVDAEVILRRGELELFAYSRAPVPKQHEAILMTEVRAEDVYRALGLIGLTPGMPMRYDPGTRTIRPPSGDAVDVFVRYDMGDGLREDSACDWMIDLAGERTMPRTPWLFTGSERLEDGSFAADIDGTLITVVDFTSSLLGLPEFHSESDADLWLAAHTEVIPPEGTAVTLILRVRIPDSPIAD